MATKEGRSKLKGNLLEMLENLERIVVDLESSETMCEADGVVLGAIYKKLKQRTCIVEEEKTIVDSSYYWRFRSILGEQQFENFKPLLAFGLQLVTSCMRTLEGQLLQLDCVTLPTIGLTRLDLYALDLKKHGKLSNKENVEELKRAKDSAAEWILKEHEFAGKSIYEFLGLLRVCYIVTEECSSPRYIRNTLAWLCTHHLNRGLESGILESYPMKYYNCELN